MLLAHKIALDPNQAQAEYFSRAAGTARFAFNWALGEWRRQYEAWKENNNLPRPSEAALRRELNAIKRKQFPWMFDVTKCAPQEAIIDLGAAFRAFFERRGNYPRFKARGRDRDSFCAANEVGTFECVARRIRLPVIGWIKTREGQSLVQPPLPAEERLMRPWARDGLAPAQCRQSGDAQVDADSP